MISVCADAADPSQQFYVKKKLSPVGLKSHDLLGKGELEHLDDVKVEALQCKS